ncbi:MAG: TetR/AcrR family transcriptional regulator [Rubrivivax sp.]
MIETAVRLFQRGGYHSTSWRTLVEAAGTPWGSAHHHFPGGKEQLGVAAIDMAAEIVALRLQKNFAQYSAAHEGARAYFKAWAASLEASNFQDGCPIATIALETAPASEALTDACRRAFNRWRALLAEQFVQVGVKRKRAGELATILLSTFEGALLVARVSKTTAPLLMAGEQMAALLKNEVP